jgi:hypothetical protein
MEREPGGLRSREQISPQEIPQLMVNLGKISEKAGKNFPIEITVAATQIAEYLKTGDGKTLEKQALEQTDKNMEETEGYLTGKKAYKWLMEQGGIEPPAELNDSEGSWR